MTQKSNFPCGEKQLTANQKAAWEYSNQSGVSTAHRASDQRHPCKWSPTLHCCSPDQYLDRKHAAKVQTVFAGTSRVTFVTSLFRLNDKRNVENWYITGNIPLPLVKGFAKQSSECREQCCCWWRECRRSNYCWLMSKRTVFCVMCFANPRKYSFFNSLLLIVDR